jgi:hypothetical protein
VWWQHLAGGFTMTQTGKLPGSAANRNAAQPIGSSIGNLTKQFLIGSVSSIFAAACVAGVSYIWGYSWFVIAGVFAAVVAVGLAVLLIIFCIEILFLRKLRKWSDLTDVTDLADFESANQFSPYMPAKIFERENITKLWAMGNGCGKWTRKVAPNMAHAKFLEIRTKSDGDIRFLASCPIYLSQRAKDDLTLSQQAKEAMKVKACDNADSLIRLRGFAEQTGGLGGNFQIKVYRHTATLRLIILNDRDCIVGHYKETGLGNSLESPLLIFLKMIDNEWGFGHAFHRLFDSEWHRAFELTSEDWNKMKELYK